MKKFISALFIITLFSQLQACSGLLSDDRTIAEQLDDNALSSAALDIVTELKIKEKDLRINFITNSGYILILGQAKTQAIKNQIGTRVQQIDKVKGVYNQLRIASPIGFEQIRQDTWITAKIKSLMSANNSINQFKIKVITENSEVFLIGKVNKEIANEASKIASEVQSVKKVHRVFQLTKTNIEKKPI